MKNLRSGNLFNCTNKSGTHLILATLFLSLMFVSRASATIVINEVYSAGGNAGATYNQDYVELYNNGTTNVDINGYSIQYNAPTATSNYTVCSITATDTIIEPRTYFLIAVGTASMTVGTALPTPNAAPGCSVNFAAGGGKIVLVNSTTQLTQTGGVVTCPPTGATIIDFVGYGNANCSETANAPAAANAQSSVQRTVTGIDTNNNMADFTSAAATPQAAGPTAAGATISGRITDLRGRGLSRIVVIMTGSGIEELVYATTSAFGYYRFEDIPAGNTYILTAISKNYVFDQPSIVISVNSDFSGADFIGRTRFSTKIENKLNK